MSRPLHFLSPLCILLIALFADSSTLECNYTGRAWYRFSHDYNVANQMEHEFHNRKTFYMLFTQLYSKCSVCRIFTPHLLECEISHPLPLLFLLFWVFRYAQLRFFYPLLDTTRVRKDTKLSSLHNFNVHTPAWGSLGIRSYMYSPDVWLRKSSSDSWAFHLLLR